jgi:hypothetical protein
MQIFAWLFLFMTFTFVLRMPEASAAKKPAGLAIECEFLLTHADDMRAPMRWFAAALSAVGTSEPVYAGYAPRPPAFRALALPDRIPRYALMKIELPRFPAEPYWIRVYTKGGKEVAKIPFHAPPLLVWKHFKGWGDHGAIELDRDIVREDARVISAGVSIGDFEDGRKFVVVRRRMANIVTVAIGIDVPLDHYQIYTSSPEPVVVSTEDNKILSRIEVIKAHFRVPGLPNY